MNITAMAKEYGCHDVVLLTEKETPQRLDYLDLLKASANGGLKVDAVAELQARHLLYVVEIEPGRTEKQSFCATRTRQTINNLAIFQCGQKKLESTFN